MIERKIAIVLCYTFSSFLKRKKNESFVLNRESIIFFFARERASILCEKKNVRIFSLTKIEIYRAYFLRLCYHIFNNGETATK